ncbi:MAG: GNAT family N-acetyltransferase [Candidatus Caldatribacteriaceae bacterium]
MVTVRLAKLTCEELEENMESLIGVYEKAYRDLPEYGYHERERIRGYLSWLWRGDPAGFLVALDRERIAGFISVHGEWEEGGEIIGEIHEFVVDPEYQARGVGNILFRAALQYAQRKGRTRIGLWVGEKNRKAIEFYVRRGFQKKEQKGKWIRMSREVKYPESA